MSSVKLNSSGGPSSWDEPSSTGGHLSAKAWPKPLFRVAANPSSKPPPPVTKAVPIVTRHPTPPAEPKPSHPRHVVVKELRPSDPSYDRVKKLGTRFLNPPAAVIQALHSNSTTAGHVSSPDRLFLHQHNQELSHGAGAGNTRRTTPQQPATNQVQGQAGPIYVYEVIGIEEVHCAEQKQTFQQSKNNELIGKTNCLVAKFFPAFSRRHILERGALEERYDGLRGPFGMGIYFPNTFTNSAQQQARQSSTPQGDGAEGEVLLCEVAQGAICLNTQGLLSTAEDTNVHHQNIFSSSSNASMAEVKGFLHRKGYDSVAASILGAAHVAVFDANSVLPTHIVRYRRAPVAGSSHQSPGRIPTTESGDANDGAPVDTGSSTAAVEQKKQQYLLEQKNAKKEKIRAAAKKLRESVHRKCTDLEESIRCRRDVLLSSIRAAEEHELNALEADTKKALYGGSEGVGYSSRRPATAAAASGSPSSRLTTPLHGGSGGGGGGLEVATIDTSRIMAMLESLRISNLTPHQPEPTVALVSCRDEGIGSSAVSSASSAPSGADVDSASKNNENNTNPQATTGVFSRPSTSPGLLHSSVQQGGASAGTGPPSTGTGGQLGSGGRGIPPRSSRVTRTNSTGTNAAVGGSGRSAVQSLTSNSTANRASALGMGPTKPPPAGRRPGTSTLRTTSSVVS